MTSALSRAPLSASTAMHDLKWSAAEKVIVRKAFNLALKRELQTVILEAKSKAAKIQEPSGLWDLEQYLTQRRQEIDRIYDYRYSVLPLVFANVLSNGRLSADELHGLGEDIQRCSSISLKR
jgi:hypothetical protein